MKGKKNMNFEYDVVWLNTSSQACTARSRARTRDLIWCTEKKLHLQKSREHSVWVIKPRCRQSCLLFCKGTREENYTDGTHITSDQRPVNCEQLSLSRRETGIGKTIITPHPLLAANCEQVSEVKRMRAIETPNTVVFYSIGDIFPKSLAKQDRNNQNN